MCVCCCRQTIKEMSQEPSLGIGWNAEDDDLLLFSELDDIIDSFHGDPLTSDDKPVGNEELSPSLSTGSDVFEWENVKFSDTEQLMANLEPGESTVSADAPCDVPLPVTADDIEETTHCKSNSSIALLNSYGLTDEQLGGISLKKLRSLCKTDSDFNDLKAYRRTCQNRYYARSSRTKQQVKTSSLATKLDQSEQKIARLQQENEMKDATIRCLQLELQILRSIKSESN